MITVFGSINMDLVATAKRLPKPGETVTERPFHGGRRKGSQSGACRTARRCNGQNGGRYG